MLTLEIVPPPKEDRSKWYLQCQGPRPQGPSLPWLQSMVLPSWGQRMSILSSLEMMLGNVSCFLVCWRLRTDKDASSEMLFSLQSDFFQNCFTCCFIFMTAYRCICNVTIEELIEHSMESIGNGVVCSILQSIFLAAKLTTPHARWTGNEAWHAVRSIIIECFLMDGQYLIIP